MAQVARLMNEGRALWIGLEEVEFWPKGCAFTNALLRGYKRLGCRCWDGVMTTNQ